MGLDGFRFLISGSVLFLYIRMTHDIAHDVPHRPFNSMTYDKQHTGHHDTDDGTYPMAWHDMSQVQHADMT